jgi:hypothetical protein
MNKEQIDELYHLLRVASNDIDRPHVPDLASGLTPREEGSRIMGLTRHLLGGGGDYPALVEFLAMYGERFLIEPISNYVKLWEFHPNRIVELGAGLGWLARGMASRLGADLILTVDKRRWTMTDVVLDLETEHDVDKLLATLKKDDLIVMCDFLHCIDNPEDFLKKLDKWKLVVVEYCPQVSKDYANSYREQLSRFGAKAFTPQEMDDLASYRPKHMLHIKPYRIYLFEGGVMYD